MYTENPTTRPEVEWIGFVLTWTAGFVDAIGFLTLRQIYVANMSGNTVAVAIHVAKRDWIQAWSHACPVAAFVPGLIAGDAIVEFCKRSKLRSSLVPALVVEAVGLALVIYTSESSISSGAATLDRGAAAYGLLTGLLAFSMGLQNGALRRIGAMKDVHTYVTGTLLAAAHGLTEYLFWLGGRFREFRFTLHRLIRSSRRHRSLRSGCLGGTLWMMYIVGATIGAVLQPLNGIDSLFLPVVILLVIALADLIKPIR
ncbi:MAG TPA: YoaK family protein [Tepidisphaeraceae bacterium]|jgi:uncharacterized membrane protein YoaK (UPF0700 family)|nr:YoaK family protein [Tepidisphaeraceae bacterium]